MENKPYQEFDEDILNNQDLLIQVHKTAKYLFNKNSTTRKSENKEKDSDDVDCDL